MIENVSIRDKLLEAAREQEVRRVEEFVENIRAGVANHFFLNFFAPRGFSKTTLLQHIWNEYERLLPASFVPVRSFCGEDQVFALSDLLFHIIDALNLRLPRRITSLPDYKQVPDKAKLVELIIDLARSARDYEKVTLLLLDDYDAMPAEDSRWFEARILSELVKTRAVAVILTSELELRFAERIDLRMRLESYELSSLSTEAISSSFPQYEGIAPEIRRITGGLPAFTEELIQQLKASHVNTAADFRSQEQELVRKYYRTYVKEVVLQSIPSDMRETILVLALLRRFDVTVLRGILSKVLPKYYQGYGTFEYLDLIERLGNQIQWRMQGGYALNQALRMVLQGYVLVEKPRLYQQVNRAAVVLYPELIKKEYREYYLMELLYHKLALLKLEKESDLSSIQAKIGHDLLQYLNGGEAAPVRETDLDSLRHSLMQDADLKDYISEDVLLAIHSLINARIEEKRVIPLNAERKSA